MRVQKVEQQNKSCLGNGLQSAVIGGAIGLASQYALPLTTQEMDSEYKTIIETIKNSAENSAKELEKTIRNASLQQPALDSFVKSEKRIADAAVRRYNMQLKAARGAAPFVIAGAVTGLLVSFIHNVFKTDAA